MINTFSMIYNNVSKLFVISFTLTNKSVAYMGLNAIEHALSSVRSDAKWTAIATINRGYLQIARAIVLKLIKTIAAPHSA